MTAAWRDTTAPLPERLRAFADLWPEDRDAHDLLLDAARAVLASGDTPQPKAPEVGDRVRWEGLAGGYEGTVEWVQERTPFLSIRWDTGGSMQADADAVTVLGPVDQPDEAPGADGAPTEGNEPGEER